MRKIKLVFIILFYIITNMPVSSQVNNKPNLGYGFSPKGHPYDYSQMGNFLQEVSNTCDGGVVLANGTWRDSVSSSGVIPKFQKDICNLQPTTFSYKDMVVFGWGASTKPYTLYLDVPGDNTNKWTNSSARKLFLQMLINAADSLKPTYFFIGNETSFYWEQDSLDYLNWVSFYNQAYDSIKVHSAASKIGTVFNYEHLAGTGKLIGWNKPYWNALNAMDTSKIDLLGLTVYPFFNYSNANAVPLNYLSPIFKKMGNKPIAITETGWPSDSLLANWNCSPQNQVDFVHKLFTMIDGHKVEVVNWLYLYYLMDYRTDDRRLSASIALHDSLGNDLPALAIWQSYCNNASLLKKNLDEQGDHIVVYPNPISYSTTLEPNFFLQDACLIVYNIDGEIVTQQNRINGKTITVNRDNLKAGLYLFHLYNLGKISSGKLIVK